MRKNPLGMKCESREHLIENSAESCKYTDREVIAEPETTEDTELEFLKRALLDKAILHTMCLEAFGLYTKDRENARTIDELKEALNHVFSRCCLDPLSDEEIEDLWIGAVNSTEFFLLCRELLTSLHQTVTLQTNFT